MARIAYILLCHKDAEGVIAQARRLTAAGDYVAIHFDGNANAADFDRIRTALAPNSGVTFAKRRVKCGWGEWSLVEASLQAVRAAVAAFPRATHFYMLSGDCMPIKSAEYAHDFLDREDADYVESFDFFKSDWIKTGIKEERLIYRHWFNERNAKALFYASMNLQRRLHLTRRVPADIQVQIGSQWWCLRRRTIETLLQFCRDRRDVIRFFRTTWIPDETFFQTLVRHLVPEAEIRTRTLTFLPISGEGRSLFAFLAARGRIGRRFAPRFWETESSLGRERTLLMVICKKWHVAKRLVERMRQETQIPAVDYLFNEAACPLPDLGGIQTTLEKRTRHRRALVRMLFDWWQSDTLILCIDPANVDLMRDFASDKARTRFLEVAVNLTDDYLIGHARRVGLAGEQTPGEVLERLLPTIRYDVRFESDRLRDADFAGLSRIREGASVDENAAALAAFLGVAPDKAHRIAATPNLFSD